MTSSIYPSLYQINTRVWLTALSRDRGRRATLDDISDDDLDGLSAMGFDWIWLLSVWQTGAAGQRISRSNARWRQEFEATLPDLTDDDIPGSGFAIAGYTVHETLGGDQALARLRERLAKRDMKLMLDFVPNHTALDHPWVETHPDYYVSGTELDIAGAPQNYTRVNGAGGGRILALGRDPFFPGWPDVMQLDYGNPQTQEAMIGELLKVASQCDGVRCDMAMLVLPEIFKRTWGIDTQSFWPAAINRVREQSPGFCFMAECYWDLEWTLQQQGFDYTYDKRLYDRLREGHARPVREHLRASLDYQNKLVRFLENHDEPRAAGVFSPEIHEAAAVITFLTPGMRFFHQGEFQGRKTHVSPHLGRAPEEPVDERLQEFYARLLGILDQPIVRQGEWQLLECKPAWEGDWTHNCFVAFGWCGPSREQLLVIVNYAANQSQCYVCLPFADLAGRRWRLNDQLSDTVYERDGHDLASRGLYLDVPAWDRAVFTITPL